MTLGANGLTYSEATSFFHLTDFYQWSIVGATLVTTRADGKGVYVDTLGASTNLDDSAMSVGQVYHLLDGDDVLLGGSGDDEIYGGAGNDTFVYLYNTVGSDTLVNFALGEDVIDLSDLLIAFDESSNIHDYISSQETDAANGYRLTIDHDLSEVTPQVVIEVQLPISITGDIVDTLIDNGSLDFL